MSAAGPVGVAAPGVGRRPPVDPRLWRRARAFRWWLAASVAVGVATAAALVAQATFLGDIAGDVVGPHRRPQAVPAALVGLAVATAVRALLAYGAEQAATGAARRTKTELRAAALRALADGDIAADRQPGGPTAARRTGGPTAGRRTGDVAVALGHGLDALDDYVGRYVPRAVLAALVPVVLVTWIAHLDLLSAAILVGTLLLLPVFMVLIGQRTERQVAARWASLATLSGQFLDAVEGLATLRAFGRVRAQRATIARTTDRLRRATLGTLKIALLSALVLEVLAATGTALVAVPLGLRLLSGHLLLAPAVTILVLTPEVYLPMRRAAAQFHASADGVAALDAVFEVLGPPAGPAGPGPASPAGQASPEQPAAAAAVATVATAGLPGRRAGAPVVELRGAVVRRAGRDRPVLGPVDLVMERGEHVGVVGPSGAGKTTLLDLVAGLVRPAAGQVLVDGVPLSPGGLQAWRARLAWAPQRPVLFSGTVADNLRLGLPDLSDAELWAALEVACLAEVVAALPGGLRAPMAEHADTLSAGERQRLAIARAVASPQAELVLLDEPTAQLDPATEAALVERLRDVVAGRGLLLVTHRRRPLDLVGRVLDLDAGHLHPAPVDGPAPFSTAPPSTAPPSTAPLSMVVAR
ncbi:MAG TPA: thiol reductant ABC exporter subunit CydD [Acidimicrobiales bacterium]|nr:thiol reductant ABC exporter subunit CydD [Acidimicrobiales bacterium]